MSPTLFYILLTILVIIGSFIQRVSGFGFGIFVMMFFPFLFPSYGESVTLSGLLAGSTALIIALQNFRYIHWRSMWIILPFNIIASLIAIEFMALQSNSTLRHYLGLFLILLSLYFIFKKKREKSVHPTPLFQATIGLISGFMGGLFAMPGPPIVIYCIQMLKDKRQYMATLQAFSVMFNLVYTLQRSHLGFLTPTVSYGWGIGLVGLIIGTLLGSFMYRRISSRTLRHIVYGLMMISGLAALFS